MRVRAQRLAIGFMGLVYLRTFTIIYQGIQRNVGKYSIHGSHGIYFSPAANIVRIVREKVPKYLVAQSEFFFRIVMVNLTCACYSNFFQHTSRVSEEIPFIF